MNAESILADMTDRAERLARLQASLAGIDAEEVFRTNPQLKAKYEAKPPVTRIRVVRAYRQRNPARVDPESDS